MDPKKQYINEMYKKFGYFATWLPTVDLEIGDIGTMKGNEFIKESTLKNKKIEYKIKPDKTPGNLQYSSTSGVSIKSKTKGELPIKGSSLTSADVGAVIEFKGKTGIVFRADKVTNTYIENQDVLGKKIMEKYREKEWNYDWVVITELFEAKTATVIISNEKGGKIELKAKGKVNPANIDIADASAKLEAVTSENINTQIIAEKGITPLFKVRGLKWGPITGGPVFKSMAKKAPAQRLQKKKRLGFKEVKLGEKR